MKNPSSRRRSPAVHAHLMKLRDNFYPELAGRPPSAEWVGPMAFTPDGLPCIGFLRPGIIVAVGYNGYGGSYATAAGHAAAEMAISDVVPEWLPEEIFSPRRLLSDQPLFLTEREGLWRVAVSLCRQVQSVNRQLSDKMTLHASSSVVPKIVDTQITCPPGESRSTDGTRVESLAIRGSVWYRFNRWSASGRVRRARSASAPASAGARPGAACGTAPGHPSRAG